MRCHAALGEWEAVRRLSDKLAEQRAVLAPGEVAELARLGAAAALDLASHATAGNERHWAALGRHAALLPARSFDGAFSRAVLALHGGDWSGAQAYIDAARGVIDAEVTGLVGESYARAYNGMVRLQRLSELEEVLLNATSPTTLPRARLLELWRGRLGHAAADLSAWRELLPVRALAVPPRHDPHGMIAFAQLCSRNGQHTLAFEALRHAEPRAAASWGDAPDMQPDVWLAYTVAIGWVHLGEWTLASAAPAAGEASLLEHFRRAAELDPASCAAWHNLAMVHFDHVRCTCWRSEDELGEHHRHHPDPGATDTEERVVAALECLFRCISLRPSSSPTGHTQQDILTLLTLAFEHGETEGAAAALSRGLADTPAETWLAVVPQVIARLGSESERVRTFVLSLLSTLAERHPQGLVYPLTVAATSPLRAQATGAAHVLAHLRRGRDVLVEQAQLVAAELVRASCLWSEAWIDGLETASKAFYTEGDDAGCVRALLPLHEALERGAQTPAEGAFVREFGGALDAARAELRQWQESGERAHLHSAWALYMGLFRAVSPRQAALTSLDLASVSPRLLGATALELAVPGTYEPQAPLVTISGFRPRLSVIASKQRPRRVMLAGDDGREYSFLLKGREDLRQDERVMQLFGLVNRLLGSTAPLAGPAIRRYAVVPLSPASGLIGWVPSCDTLHQLVRHHREYRGGGELRAYNALPLLHRVEVFAAALSRTGGRDLAEALWLRSPSAEWWLERRSSYTRSVGVMCVVGYILGLGDRHLNNMLLDRVSGEVVHIDYGDCFEAAALRPRFPETVPFRLTRMLVTAMGVAGVDGVYRSTCEGAMRALRRHRSSVLAMLEAFLYDPLVHWNLDGAERGSAKRVSSRASLDGGEARGGAARGDKVMHAQALRVLRRVKSKLDGSEFGAAPIDVPTQVDRLVHEAQAHTNLAQMWGGWNPFW
ncbi:putative target of rapamycin protein [Emiliania huxleyi CCMP1516]|uniref:non-specific serine/threonine protein kinase n=3 Tax=Emiliania huxleyi TaxID=2903 RepID=A0A0D3HY57_EMIH1|nr:putative target of rapamycin protein [Emiliania huxleyi CCMP1516]EOD03942.1 putative target of rapamycin protein [Emiliania huxleyi CCMP1516]|eukprot:XP_005756371.1 putative target of rapamycin protein [Emiliania huxleyi CCMP1516]